MIRYLFTLILLFTFQSKAEVEFKKGRIKVANKRIEVEFAVTPEQREHGLMFRKSLAQDTGMLFVFEDEQVLGFWMRNTLIPLSIGYYDSNRVLVEVFEMVPEVAGTLQPKVYRSTKPAKYALEMPSGWYKKNKISPGTKFEFISRP